MSYAPLRFRAQHDGSVLCTSDGGSFFKTTADFATRFANGQITPSDQRFLRGRGELIEPNNGLGWEVMAHSVARRLTLAQRLDYLILVPTLRCNLRCDYCQVSRVDEHHTDFDWDEDTLNLVLKFIDALETPNLKIEFQGGEPTLRPDLLETVINHCGRFEQAEFVICTNLQNLNDRVMRLFDRDNVFISTSLDGPEALHQQHRTITSEKTQTFLENLDLLTQRYGRGKISALPTINAASPPDADQLIETYSQYGFNSIFLRPINFQGFARKRYKDAVANPVSWMQYYENFVRNIIRRNWQDRSRVLQETYLGICLRRIFQPGAERHVDLRNPNPVGVDYVVIDYDGIFYPTDEARMLARSGVIDLSIGNLRDGFDITKRDLMNRSASNSFDPDCKACAFQPYCGRDLIDDLARYGSIDVPRLDTEFCRRHRHIFDFAFELIYSDDPETRYSLCQWLGIPGELELGESWQ